MPCTESQSGWCKAYPVVYKNKEGREYCVFHAPVGGKETNSEKFNELVFEKIKKTEPNQICDFSGTIFEWEISFRKVQFKATDFSNATFSERSNFEDATFSGSANFSGAAFSKRVDFFRATFSEEADFSGTTFSNWADFRTAIFFKNAFFSNSKFLGQTSFNGETFLDNGNFQNVFINEIIRFEGVSVKKVTFLDTDLRKMDFKYCKWENVRGRFVLYDEIQIWSKRDYREKEYGKITKVEILYRSLKQKSITEKDKAAASNWHYGEHEMFRKANLFRRFFPFSISFLYWISSGYGERPFRAGITLLFLIFTISVIFGITGIKPINEKESSKEISIIGKDNKPNFHNFGKALLATIQFVTLEGNPKFVPATLIGEYLKIAATIIVPFQGALFILALRNRYRR